MLLAPGRRRAITGAMRSAETGRTAMVAAADGMIKALPRQVRLRRTVSVFTTCTAMSGNGLRTAGTTATSALRRTVGRASQEIVRCASVAAAPGTAVRGSCVRRTASGTRPDSVTTSSGSVLPGRFPHESFPPCLGVPRGCAPWRNPFTGIRAVPVAPDLSADLL